MQPQYRYLAKQRPAKATDLLVSGDEDNLTYACIELRKCIEALSYELLMGYLSEVPLKALETWQPDKVMKEYSGPIRTPIRPPGSACAEKAPTEHPTGIGWISEKIGA